MSDWLHEVDFETLYESIAGEMFSAFEPCKHEMHERFTADLFSDLVRMLVDPLSESGDRVRWATFSLIRHCSDPSTLLIIEPLDLRPSTRIHHSLYSELYTIAVRSLTEVMKETLEDLQWKLRGPIQFELNLNLEFAISRGVNEF